MNCTQAVTCLLVSCYQCSVLSDPLVFPPDSLRGKRILELGSGVGLCGLVAAKLGGHVVLTDQANHISCLESNVRLFKQDAKMLESRSAVVCLAKEYTWGDFGTQWLAVCAALRGAEGAKGSEFDLVIGADIVYRSDWAQSTYCTSYCSS